MTKALHAIATLAIALLTSANVQAQTWTGCYVGAQAGYGATHNATSLDIVGAGTILQTGLSSQGGAAGLHAGCDVQIQQFVVGAYGDYNWLNQSMAVNSPLLGGSIARLDYDSSWTIGGRAGIVFGNSLVFGKVGWTRASTSDLSVFNGTATFAVPTLEGWSVGGGISTVIMPNVRLGVEYAYTRFDKVGIDLVPGFLSATLQPDMHMVSARVSYAFDLFPQSAGFK